MSTNTEQYRFTTCIDPVLPLHRARVLFDGCFSEPRLQHPEGVAIGPDGWLWCSSENGQILRVSLDGQTIEEVASTGGFTLGLAFDGDRALYVCDSKYSAVFRLDLHTRQFDKFSSEGIRIPNYPVVDPPRNRLYVSDSFESGTAGPGIWSYNLDTGDGHLWYDAEMAFANGMCLSLDQQALFCCETFARKIVKIPFNSDGSAGNGIDFRADLPGLPDGLALDNQGNIFVGCYEPSRILRVSADGKRADVYIEDPTAHVFCHPTNIAFDGSMLYTANLGRWHISAIATDTQAKALGSFTPR